jgi:photosystem II stability/assembly factor-like uncharacterized protein
MKSGIRILLTIIFINHISFIFAQDFWEQLYFPDTVTIRCMTTNNQGDIFIGVGSSNETGGVYRSTDNAQTWEFVYDNSSFGVLSIAIDANGYVYVGKNGSSRLIVTKNNGENWEEIILPSTSYGNVMKILCVGQDTIYVSTWESVGSYITYSFDGGETWQYSYVTDHPNEYVSDIDISNTGEIFVSLSGFFNGQGGVYKSADGGANWIYVGLLNHQVLTIAINSNNEVFTGDWWVMNWNDTPGIHALYEGSDEFELIFDAYHATDIVIDSNGNIYAAANEGVVRSFNNGQSFEIIEDELSTTIEFLHIGFNEHLYGIRFNRIVKSIDPIMTVIDDSHIVELIENVRVYPNPVSTMLYLDIGSKHKHASFNEVFIYDIHGKSIYINEKAFLGNPYQFDVSQLSQGLYLIKIQQNGKILNARFIKK